MDLRIGSSSYNHCDYDTYSIVWSGIDFREARASEAIPFIIYSAIVNNLFVSTPTTQ